MENPSIADNNTRRGDVADIVYHLSDEGDFAYFTQPLQFRTPSVPAVEQDGLASPLASPREVVAGSCRSDTASASQGTYWTVRTISTRTEKKACACIGEMDTTSVFAFRDSEGNKGRQDDERVGGREKDEGKEDGKIDPPSSHGGGEGQGAKQRSEATIARLEFP